jgi:hypothetical protein
VTDIWRLKRFIALLATSQSRSLFCVVAVATMCSTVLSACGGGGGGASATARKIPPTTARKVSPPPHRSVPLQPAGPWSSTYTYTLDALRSCEVGDGLAILANVGSVSVRITKVAVDISGDDTPIADQRSFQILELPEGSTTGELSDSYTLKELNGRRVLGSVVGSVLAPTPQSRRWYGIIARLRVLVNHPGPWKINGVSVGYSSGSQQYLTFFPQSVNLPSTTNCGK